MKHPPKKRSAAVLEGDTSFCQTRSDLWGKQAPTGSILSLQKDLVACCETLWPLYWGAHICSQWLGPVLCGLRIVLESAILVVVRGMDAWQHSRATRKGYEGGIMRNNRRRTYLWMWAGVRVVCRVS